MPGKKNATSTAAVSGASEPCTALASMLSAKVGADGALVGLLRVGGAHQFAVLGDGALAFQRLDHHRAGDHEVTRSLKNGRALCTA
jgi:hypothetical protein